MCARQWNESMLLLSNDSEPVFMLQKIKTWSVKCNVLIVEKEQKGKPKHQWYTDQVLVLVFMIELFCLHARFSLFLIKST